jgi:hypothetical protein
VLPLTIGANPSRPELILSVNAILPSSEIKAFSSLRGNSHNRSAPQRTASATCAEGDILRLQVPSGPTILAPAVREAVRKWRFKPHIQHGRAVETQAEIGVNFLISTT